MTSLICAFIAFIFGWLCGWRHLYFLLKKGYTLDFNDKVIELTALSGDFVVSSPKNEG